MVRDAVMSMYTVDDVAADPANALLLGCSTTEPTQLPASAVHVTSTAALSDVTSCRSACFQNALNIAIFRSNQVPLLLLLYYYTIWLNFLS